MGLKIWRSTSKPIEPSRRTLADINDGDAEFRNLKDSIFCDLYLALDFGIMKDLRLIAAPTKKLETKSWRPESKD
jgi:hypothetical protein